MLDFGKGQAHVGVKIPAALKQSDVKDTQVRTEDHTLLVHHCGPRTGSAEEETLLSCALFFLKASGSTLAGKGGGGGIAVWSAAALASASARPG